ncbi:MAG: glycoside hydrolase family 76 protein [Prevotellaceae bacterium]|nr:glycoside hydrolase family 76 protein [Prevotellaceae bacterium]
MAEQNLMRAMQLIDSTIACYFANDEMLMSRYYNPFTKTCSEETGSVWMYTAAIESVNAVMNCLKTFRDKGRHELYDKNFETYSDLLHRLYKNADYYLGTFTLTSYTQTKEWSVYGVNRGKRKGKAKVEGIENVYDDQMWLVRELIEAYKLTGKGEYLDKAEYLTEYVLDGWDCTRLPSGEEAGGITWGPGYVSKHSCSNGPMISPLVWLHELYKDKKDEIEYRFIDASDKKTRKTQQMKKSDFYLDFAKKIYSWQKKYLLRADGVYDDMMGGCSPGKPTIESIEGISYKCGIVCRDRVGPAITYNSGTMLSGAADLYRATENKMYLDDAKSLSEASFSYFAKLGATINDYYSYSSRGFNNWFNGVLMRGYFDIYPVYHEVNKCLESFQRNLDYGYDNFFYSGFLPNNLLTGWRQNESNNRVEAMFNFAFAAEYAILSQYLIEINTSIPLKYPPSTAETNQPPH